MNQAERFWDGRADSFDGSDESDGQADSEGLANIVRHLRPTDVVLDFGCATGTWSLALAGHVREVHGMDISSKMIALAGAKAAALGVGNVRFSQGTLLDLETDERFDVILGLNVLHLLDDAPRTMERIQQLLRPGGRFISDTPCLGQGRSVMSLLMRGISKTGIVPHLSVLTSDDVLRLVADAGLQTIEKDIRAGSTTTLFVVAEKN